MKLEIKNIRFGDDYIILDGIEESLSFKKEDIAFIHYGDDEVIQHKRDLNELISQTYKKIFTWNAAIFGVPLYIYIAYLFIGACFYWFKEDFFTKTSFSLRFSLTLIVPGILTYFFLTILNYIVFPLYLTIFKTEELWDFLIRFRKKPNPTIKKIRIIDRANEIHWFLINKYVDIKKISNFWGQPISPICFDKQEKNILPEKKNNRNFISENLVIKSNFLGFKIGFIEFKLQHLFFIGINYFHLFSFNLLLPDEISYIFIMFFWTNILFTLLFIYSIIRKIKNKTLFLGFNLGFEIDYHRHLIFDPRINDYVDLKDFSEMNSKTVESNIKFKIYAKGVYNEISLNGIIDYPICTLEIDHSISMVKGQLISIYSNEDKLLTLWRNVFKRNPVSLEENSKYIYCYELYTRDLNRIGIENPTIKRTQQTF
jgi:hypothetical protein